MYTQSRILRARLEYLEDTKGVKYGSAPTLFLDHFPRSFKLCYPPHAPRAVIFLVPHAYRVLIGACDPMVWPILGL